MAGELTNRVPTKPTASPTAGAKKVEIVVYKGYGHGITKPKSMRAVMQHNLSWFNHYIWGDPLPDFTAPELPKKETKDEKRDSEK